MLALNFGSPEQEASWIARTIKTLRGSEYKDHKAALKVELEPGEKTSPRITTFPRG
jgi:hypothetical protein